MVITFLPCMVITFLALVGLLWAANASSLVPYTCSPLPLARADWKETKTEHQISLDIPGMRKEDIKIEVEENRVLRISGEPKTEEEVKVERWHSIERTAGKFLRQFSLPANADTENVNARLQDGVLRITVPKLKEQETKKEPKVINIVADDDQKRIESTHKSRALEQPLPFSK